MPDSDMKTALLGRHWTRPRFLGNSLLTTLCISLSVATLIPLGSILFLVLQKGIPLLSWQLFTQLPPAAGLTGGGIGNALTGSAFMVGLAMLMASPLGILAALYTSEYNPLSQLTRAVRFSAKLLTGIPSIICGVFAFSVIVLPMGHFSALAGSVALAVLALPTILLTTEQALLSVPRNFHEASYALGASRFQTIWRVALPEALPAIMTGLMLALARAAGETAPLIFTALFSAYWTKSPMDPSASLSVQIYNFATLPYAYQVQLAWTASLVLVALVTITNVAAHLVFSRKD